MNTIKKIVLTGGPCAGKTTALVKVIEHFSSLGYKVFTIPEVPTLFTQSGMNYLTKNEKFFFEYGGDSQPTGYHRMRPWYDGYFYLSLARILESHHL